MPVHNWRKQLTDCAVWSAILSCAFGLILYGRETAAAASEGIALCGKVLVPSLFPFFVISSLAVDTGLAERCGRLFEKPMRVLFNVPGACAPAFILGLVGGYPVGARTAIALYRNKDCSHVQAQRLLAFCNNSGPAFILGAVGGLFGGTMAGLLLYGAHILASVTVGVLLRRIGGDTPAFESRMRRDGGTRPRVGKALTSAVVGSFQQLINLCAFVIFFSVAIRLLCVTGLLPVAARAAGRLLGTDPLFAEKLLSGVLEVTSGVYGLTSAGVSLSARLTAAAFMLGWAGVSVHCQVLNFIGESGLSCRPYLLGKLLHGWLSALYVWIGTRLLPFDAQVGPAIKTQLQTLTSRSAERYLLLSLLSSMLLWAVLEVLPRFFTCQRRNK